MHEMDLAAGVELPACPSCGNEEIPPPLVYEASVHSDGHTVGLSRCPGCGVYFTRPRFARHNVRTREARYEDIVEKYGPEARSGEFHKSGNFRYYLRLAEEHLRRRNVQPPFRVLDIGAHCGFFLRAAKERGWVVRGIEPAPPMARFAREMNEIDAVQQGFFDETSLLDQTFHLVTMFDVLEHIPDPVRLLSAVRARLRLEGLVLCKVPHIGFYVTWRSVVMALSAAGVLPKYPTYVTEPPPEASTSNVPPLFDLFEHVVHYDATAVARIFPRAGFAATRILPAPPTNPKGHPLNAPRSLTYWGARLMHLFRDRPGALTHGLLILGYPEELP